MRVKLLYSDGHTSEHEVDGYSEGKIAEGILRQGRYFFQTTLNYELWPKIITYQEGLLWQIN